jgi:hypothetical protein
MQLDAHISSDWQASLIFASMPTGPEPRKQWTATGSTLAAADELDAFLS